MIDYAYTIGNSILINGKVQMVTSIISNFPLRPVINGTLDYYPVEIGPVLLPNGKYIKYLHHLENYRMFSNLDNFEINERFNKFTKKTLMIFLGRDVVRHCQSAIQEIQSRMARYRI